METTASKARALLTEQVRLKKKTYGFKYADMVNRWEDRLLRYRLLELNAKENVSRVALEQHRLKFTDMTRKFFKNFSGALEDMEKKAGKKREGLPRKGKRADTFETVMSKVRNDYSERDDIIEKYGELMTPDGASVSDSSQEKAGSGSEGDTTHESPAELNGKGRQAGLYLDLKNIIKKQRNSLDLRESERVKEKFDRTKSKYPATSLKGPYMTHKVELNDYKVIPGIGEKIKEGATSSSEPGCDVSAGQTSGKERKDYQSDSENGINTEDISKKGLEAVSPNLDKTGQGVYISTSGTKISSVETRLSASEEAEVKESGTEIVDSNDAEVDRKTLTNELFCADDCVNKQKPKVNGKTTKRKKSPPGRPDPGYIRVPPYAEYSILKNRMVVHRDVLLPKCLLTNQEREVVRKERYGNWFKNIRTKHNMYVRKHRSDVAQWLATL
jgi:hypothetical protein